MLSKPFIISCFLLFLTALSSWLVLHSQQTFTTASSHSGLWDSSIKDARVMQMNGITGLPQETLQAAEMTHFTAHNLTAITKPQWTIYQATGEPWHLIADQGQAKHDVNIVQLWGHVVLAEAAGPQNKAMTILTPAVTVYPKQHYAQTAQPVFAAEPGANMHAIGMHVDFKTQIVQLYSQVYGQYQGSQNG
jgi:LPS export ABC transporter protein LptC